MPRELRAEGDAGHRIVKGVAQDPLVLRSDARDARAGEPQAGGRLPGVARDVHAVARRRAGAGEGRPRRPSPERHRDHGLRRRGQIAAHQVRAEFAGAGDRAAGDRERELLALPGRETDREQEELGQGAHRGEVRQVHRGRAPAQALGIFAGEKVHAFDEQVRRGGEQAFRAADEGRVVSGAEDRAAAGQKGAQLFDEPVFGLHARGAGGAFRGPGAVTGISRPGVSGGRASVASGAPVSGSCGSSAIARTSSMFST